MTLPFEAAARARLGEALFAYLIGRARDTDPDVPDANEQALARLRLLPRVMRGCTHVDIARALGPRRFGGPLAVGMFAGDRLFHEEGLLPVARVCQRLNLPLFISEETVTPLARLTATHDACWLQIRACGPLDRARRLADLAVESGASGLILTVLAPAHPAPGAQPGGFDVGAELVSRGWGTIGAEEAGIGIGILPAFPHWRWQDVAALVDHLDGARLPVLVKGVLHPDDAVAAQTAGCFGVIAANVGLRQCGRWASPIPTLPEIRRRTRGAVLLDGGVRHGVDAVVACCLGADFAVATRPVACALAAGGEAAVAGLLSGWLDEITSVTSWLGVAALGELDASYLQTT